MSSVQLKDARREGINLLKSQTNESSFCLTSTPVLDCDCILSYVFNISKEFIFSHPEFEIPLNKYDFFIECIHKRISGLPVAYIISQKEFYGLDFYVTPDVLIPKYDTEILVEASIQEITDYIYTKKTDKIKILDLCTGSGCIAISVYNAFVHKGFENLIDFYACDISEKALEIATHNANKHNCKINFIKSDLLNFFVKDYFDYFDFILTNPPYVPFNIANDLLKDGRNEPMLALNGDCDGSIDGTGLIKKIIPQAYSVLKRNGCIFMETGEYNINLSVEFFKNKSFSDIKILNDYAGLQRVIKAYKK